MKKLGLSLLLTTILLFSTTAKSFYNSSDMPMIKMMSVMMQMMSRMMMGGGSSMPLSPMSGLGGLGGLPMSPANPLMSMYGMNGLNSLSGLNGLNNLGGLNGSTNPWQNTLLANNQTSPFTAQALTPPKQDSSMNGIWQALSGDILAIYHNNNFIWTDGKTRHLVGTMTIKGNQLSAFMPVQNKVINFLFYRENNKFAVKDSSGQMHVFTRIH